MTISFDEFRKAFPPKDQPAKADLKLVGGTFDIDGFMARHFPGSTPAAYQDGRKWIMQVCPWNSEHTNAAAYVIQFGNGALSAGCRHNGCANNKWQDLRAMYEPKQAWQPPPGKLPAKQVDKVEPKSNNASGLEAHIEKVISGEIVNTEWAYSPALTGLARCLLPGTITCLCGTAGSTKSMFISQECVGWLENGTPFAVFHLEEDRTFHQHRAFAQLAKESSLTENRWVEANSQTVRELMATHRPTLDKLGDSIWDAPESDVSLDDVLQWVKARAAEGKRVIVVDPITAADSGAKPWAADRKFILDAKRVMRESGASLVLVTHPRSDSLQAGTTLDNLAGGRAYNRFTQAVLWLTAMEPTVQTVKRRRAGHLFNESATVNRTILIRKARSGPGQGSAVAYYFNPMNLNFTELGILCEEKE